jgi:hypothetical protein
MLMFALLAAAQAGGTMMADDWNPMTVSAVGVTTEGPLYIEVQAGDLDGDGVSDDAYLKLICADGKLQQALYQVKGPRDSASGQASGKRMHKPVTFVKEWGPASPQLLTVKPTYDVKTLKGNERVAADPEGWAPLSLSSGDQLCSVLTQQRITKSRSNIQNN